MPEFISDQLPDPVSLRDTKFDPTSGEVLGNTADSIWNSLPTMRQSGVESRRALAGMAPTTQYGTGLGSMPYDPETENLPHTPTETMTAADANTQAKQAGAKLTPFTEPTHPAVVQSLIDDHLAEQKRQDVIERNTSLVSGAVPRFAVGALVSLADPLNIAAMMIPGAPEAWVAARLAAAGGMAGRAGVRAAVGASAGALGMAALEPLNYAFDQVEHKDWSAGEALRNIAFGAALGAAGHTLFGAIGDRLSPETRDAALRASVGQVMDGRPVDVEAIIRKGLSDDVDTALRRPEIQPLTPEEGTAPPPANTTPSMRADMEATLAKVEAQLADPAIPDEARASLTREAQALREGMAEPDTLRTQADVSAKDMTARANETPPEVVQAEKANAAVIERAPKLETVDKATAEIEDMAKEYQARYEAHVPEGPEGQPKPPEAPEIVAMKEQVKMMDAETKAHTDYLNCFLGRI